MRRDFIVLMLSLDISGAYNNIPYKRLLYILGQRASQNGLYNLFKGLQARKKHYWSLVDTRASLLQLQQKYHKDYFFLPILFLFFISNLLKTFKKGATQGIGFVNNTNLIIYGPIAIENCRTLEKAYNIYIEQVR